MPRLLSCMLLAGLAACASMDPQRAESMRQAQAASDLGDWGRAASLWYRMYREDGTRPASLAAPTAEALLRSGDAASALSVVRDGRRLGSSSPALDRVAAHARAELGDRQGAIEDMRAALREDPVQADGWWCLSQWLTLEDDPRRAHEALKRAQGLGLESHGMALHEARLLTALGRDIEAHDAWCRALEPEVDDAQTLVEGARLAVRPRLAVERPAALALGVAWYERAVALEPQALESQRAFAHAALLAGDDDKAVAAFERASELDPTDQITLSDLAALHLARGDKERARELLLRALDLETDGEAVQKWRARIDAITE